jgi:hypothetical protein
LAARRNFRKAFGNQRAAATNRRVEVISGCEAVNNNIETEEL